MVRTLLALALLVALPAVPALAQEGGDAGEAARGHFQRGVQAYDRGDYDVAIREFRAAYAATGHPDILYNIYTAAERDGDLRQAEAALASYLDEGEVDPERRPSLQARLENLRARMKGDDVEAPPEEGLRRSPGEAGDPPDDRSAESDGGGSRVHPAAIALLGTGGALAVSFAVFAGLSEAKDQNLASSCGRDAGGSCTDDQVRALRGYNIAADASWIGALATGAVGLTLLFALRDGDEVEEAPAASAWVGSEGGGVVLQGRF